MRRSCIQFPKELNEILIMLAIKKDFRIKEFSPCAGAFTNIQFTCTNIPRLRISIRRSYKRSSFAGIDPATRHAQWVWPYGLNHSTIRAVILNLTCTISFRLNIFFPFPQPRSSTTLPGTTPSMN